MKPVRCPSPGSHVFNSDDRSCILREEVVPEEHILILMNFLGLLLRTHLSGRNIELPAEAENRWTQMLNKYCIFRSSEDLSAVLSDLLSIECARRGRDVSHSCDEGCSSHSEVPQVINDGSAVMGDIYNSSPEPYVSIDVPSVVDQQQRIKERIGGESADTKKRANSMIIETTLAIAAQAAGALVSRAFSESAHSSWISNFAAVGTVFGISFPLLGIGLRHVKPKLSSIMAKLGAVAMSSAIILALGLTVVPAVAWTAGTMACLLIAIGVAMA